MDNNPINVIVRLWLMMISSELLDMTLRLGTALAAGGLIGIDLGHGCDRRSVRHRLLHPGDDGGGGDAVHAVVVPLD